MSSPEFSRTTMMKHLLVACLFPLLSVSSAEVQHPALRGLEVGSATCMDINQAWTKASQADIETCTAVQGRATQFAVIRGAKITAAATGISFTNPISTAPAVTEQDLDEFCQASCLPSLKKYYEDSATAECLLGETMKAASQNLEFYCAKNTKGSFPLHPCLISA